MVDTVKDNNHGRPKRYHHPNTIGNTRDFHLIPIPRRLRYGPGVVLHFGKGLNALFAFASAAAITQLYLSTPILTKLGQYFNVPSNQVQLFFFRWRG
jgi:hypothetical protein